MTNPRNKKTHDQFLNEIPKELGITIIGDYINTDTKIEFSCKHGTRRAFPWQIIKFKYCCRKGYYESGKMWESNINTLEELRQRVLKIRTNVDVSETYIKKERYKKLKNIRCTVHNLYYDGYGVMMGKCPECHKEENLRKILLAGPIAWRTSRTGKSVSNSETKWLDSLGVEQRQVWLEDVRYKVDGYDPTTKTVYLYHGRFWHGCPKTYDPEMVHPIVKLPMKDLYEKTLLYENKIKEAGYNLIVKWGT